MVPHPSLSSSATAADNPLLIGGSPDAISAFYNRHFDDILRYFYRRTRDAEVAADLTSETFAKVVANRRKFDAEKGSEAQWLYGIARNQLREFWRKRNAGRATQQQLQMAHQQVDTDTAHELSNVVVDEQVVIDAIDGLSGRYRQAVALRILDDYSYEEIGAQIGCTAGAARVRVFRGLKKLEAVFDDY